MNLSLWPAVLTFFFFRKYSVAVLNAIDFKNVHTTVKSNKTIQLFQIIFFTLFSVTLKNSININN